MLPRLVQFHVLPDGFTMRCHYCAAGRLVAAGDAATQILLFQEEHFGCDPALQPCVPARG